MKLNFEKKSIRNLLTIRYDPTEKSLISNANWKDFNEKNQDPLGLITKNLLTNAIAKKLKNFTGPISISLSSGIDSTLCLSLLREIFPNNDLIGICGIFQNGFDESKQASKIAKKFDSKFKTIKMPSIYKTMPKLISITKKPKWNTYSHIIAREGKNFSDVYISGDGADEVFGGYTFRYSKFLDLYNPNSNWKKRVKNYLECHNRDWVPDQKMLFGKSIKFQWNEIYNYFKPYFSNSLHPLQQVMLADYNGKLLHDFIPTSRAICKHYDLKGIFPFLDSSVRKFGFSLKINEKYDEKTEKGKLVLRRITDNLKTKHIDEKRGFSPELWYDWKNYGKKIFEKYVLSKESEVIKNDMINPKWIHTAFEYTENDGSIRYLNRLTSILAIEIWIRTFISKEMTVDDKL